MAALDERDSLADTTRLPCTVLASLEVGIPHPEPDISSGVSGPSKTAARKPRRYPVLATGLILILLAALGLTGCGPEDQSARETRESGTESRTELQPTAGTGADGPSGVPAEDEEAERVPKELEKLQQELESISEVSESVVGVAVLPLEGPLSEGGQVVGAHAHEAFPSASLIKILVLVELMHRVEAGELSLEDKLLVEPDAVVGGAGVIQSKEDELPEKVSVRRLAELMITVSDNTATNVLIDELGIERIDARADSLGLETTYLGRKMMHLDPLDTRDSNRTSAEDMVRLLGGLWRGGVGLSLDSRKFILNLLADQTLNSKLPEGLPKGTTVAHKTGELDAIEHDAGVVIIEERTFAIAVLTEGPREDGVEAIRASARAAHEHLAK